MKRRLLTLLLLLALPLPLPAGQAQETAEQAQARAAERAEQIQNRAADIGTRSSAVAEAETDLKDAQSADPFDSEEAQKKAEAALLRTGPTGPDIQPITATWTEIVPSSATVTALNNRIENTASTLQANAVELDQAISDLGAKVTKMAIVVNLQSDVLFDFDKAEIKPAAEQALARVALIIRKKGTGKVLIEGHTDAMGSVAYNQKLSERRAMAVKNWLVQHGAIVPDRMVTKGYGESRPVAPNTNADGTDNPEGRAKNRRVEITIATVEDRG
jgi:outer membrane protein OmpA-like peptidoglycan-associated protein